MLVGNYCESDETKLTDFRKAHKTVIRGSVDKRKYIYKLSRFSKVKFCKRFALK